MLLPTGFAGLEADYWHLREAVQLWDVACERQIELRGPDAMRLAQLLTVRDLNDLSVGRCMYAPVVDQFGRMINDPIITRIDDDRVWMSIADSGRRPVGRRSGRRHGTRCRRVRGRRVAAGACRGRWPTRCAAAVFGDEVRELGFFDGPGSRSAASSSWSPDRAGVRRVASRSTSRTRRWGSTCGTRSSTRANRSTSVRRAPNLIERIEGGLLSYGNDMTREHSPLECGLDRFCSLDAETLTPQTSLGIDAVRAEAALGVSVASVVW